MGGTNIRIARVSLRGNKEPILESAQYPMPGSKRECTVDEFFDEIAALIAPFMASVECIGICFSFPSEIQPDLDGRILGFNKEIHVLGSKGLLIGESLRKALSERGLPSHQNIVVLNDTTATMLGGLAIFGNQEFDGAVGFVLGTGMNCCYEEWNRNILKNDLLKQQEGRSVINVEAGGYARLLRTKVDVDFDATTGLPGTQLLEKLVSGAYLGKLLLAYIEDAIKRGCLSASFSDYFHDLENKEAAVLCALDGFNNENSLSPFCGIDPCDRNAMASLFRAFLDRSADALAVCLTAILVQADIGGSQTHPALICVEGSVYEKCKPLHDRLLARMYNVVPRIFGRHCSFVHVKNATLIGAALAAAQS
jgi:hexokinase